MTALRIAAPAMLAAGMMLFAWAIDSPAVDWAQSISGGLLIGLAAWLYREQGSDR